VFDVVMALLDIRFLDVGVTVLAQALHLAFDGLELLRPVGGLVYDFGNFVQAVEVEGLHFANRHLL
jgi:hypothetical protein